MTQIAFGLKDAHEALDDFLNGDRMERWIAAGDDYEKSDAIAYIVPAEAMHEYRTAYDARNEVQRIREDAAAEPEGYLPFRHSPLADPDGRLLPIEPLQEHLARVFYRKDVADLDDKEAAHVSGAAIMCVLDTRLDPDGQGAVPILSLGHNHDEPGKALRWQLAFVTGVRGLYLRVTANGFLGEEWGIVTGSGYRLASGWYDRDVAQRAVDALGRVLPDTDWMQMTPDSFSPDAIKAVAVTVKRYHYFGEDEKAPQPEEALTEAAP